MLDNCVSTPELLLFFSNVIVLVFFKLILLRTNQEDKRAPEAECHRHHLALQRVCLVLRLRSSTTLIFGDLRNKMRRIAVDHTLFLKENVRMESVRRKHAAREPGGEGTAGVNTLLSV